MNLTFRLPYDSETKSEISEITPEARLWNNNTYMLANVYDAVMYGAWVAQAIASKKGHKPKQPKPFARPKMKQQKKTRKPWPGKTIVSPRGGDNG